LQALFHSARYAMLTPNTRSPFSCASINALCSNITGRLTHIGRKCGSVPLISNVSTGTIHTNSVFISDACLLILSWDNMRYIVFSARIWQAFEITECAEGSHVNGDWTSGVDSERRFVWHANHCLNNAVYRLIGLNIVCRGDYKRSCEQCDR
jgi:hypothetical protein